MKRMGSRMKRVAIFGATGYTGFELVRMLLSHKGVKISVLTSEQYSDQSLEQAFAPFKGKLTGTSFGKMEAMLGARFDVAFLALPHTVSSSVAGSLLSRGIPVIDLSADFRFRSIPLYESVYGVTHKSPGLSESAVYGLPEIYRERIRKTRLAAVPGCFPTSVILALYPLLSSGLIDRKGIVADCKTGVSGGGRGPSLGFHYPEVEEGVRPYGLPKHRHNPEMDQELSLAAGGKVSITFVPHLMPMVRGILATCYAVAGAKAKGKDIEAAYRNAYGGEPFIRMLPPGLLPSTKDVRGSNFCDVAWRLDERSRRVVVVSAIDNLVKGAAGAAVQCFNLMAGFPEEEGLRAMPLFP
jgi:N-acetyl-gamma-glutamyl-phosphate reductase